jgi:hypothetical protein
MTATAHAGSDWRNIALRASNVNIEPASGMEHRWGRRRPCRARICISAGGGATGLGRLRDVSMSGAFLETAVPLALFSQLAIAVLRGDGSRHALEFPAVVVRHDQGGVGIEWCDPNPRLICRALGCGMDCAHAGTSS